MTIAAPRTGGVVVAGFGLVLLTAALLLAATGTSRAVALVLTPIGAALVLGGGWTQTHGRWPARGILITVVVVLGAVLVVGLWTLVIGLTHPPHSVLAR
jgi:hypothetical protein